jgi:hypothetical protein
VPEAPLARPVGDDLRQDDEQADDRQEVPFDVADEDLGDQQRSARRDRPRKPLARVVLLVREVHRGDEHGRVDRAAERVASGVDRHRGRGDHEARDRRHTPERERQAGHRAQHVAERLDRVRVQRDGHQRAQQAAGRDAERQVLPCHPLAHAFSVGIRRLSFIRPHACSRVRQRTYAGGSRNGADRLRVGAWGRSATGVCAGA